MEPGAGYDRCGVAADLRVDDHVDPVGELSRLLAEWELYFGRPEDVQPLEGLLADEVAERLALLGHTGAAGGVEAALAAWAGEVNYESRLAPGGIDSLPNPLGVVEHHLDLHRSGDVVDDRGLIP